MKISTFPSTYSTILLRLQTQLRLLSTSLDNACSTYVEGTYEYKCTTRLRHPINRLWIVRHGLKVLRTRTIIIIHHPTS